MTKYVKCIICNKQLIGDDDINPREVVCKGCMGEVITKAIGFDNYTKSVENGDIVVLNRKEIKELLGDWDADEIVEYGFIIKFLEEHSNWRRKP